MFEIVNNQLVITDYDDDRILVDVSKNGCLITAIDSYERKEIIIELNAKDKQALIDWLIRE